MKKIVIGGFVALLAIAAHADPVTQNGSSTASAQQQASSAAQSQGLGALNIAAAPGDQHLSETVRNVSAPVLGAYAGSFSQMGCGSTAQAGLAVAGVSLVGGASHSMQDCVSEVAANETMKQATADPENAPRLRAAAVAIRCQVSEEVYKAYIAAGLDCKGLKPKSMESRTDTQPASTRVE